MKRRMYTQLPESGTTLTMLPPSSHFLVVLVTSLSAICAATNHGAIFTEEQGRELEDLIRSVMDCTPIPGLSIVVMKGKQTWTGAFGQADVSSGRPVSSSTLFGVGSLTKAFTVSLLDMFLNESSSFSWETPLKTILGHDFSLGDDYITSHVTLKDLLTHRTGLSESIMPMFTGGPDNSSLQLLEKRLRHLPVSGAFRDGFVYNDFMYSLAARVAEVLGGASWEELLHKHLLQPVKMEHARLFGPALEKESKDSSHLATSYRMIDGGRLETLDSSVYTDIAYPSSGGLALSADDVRLWMHVLLHQGVTADGTRVLPENTIRTMQTARVLLPAKDGLFLFKPQFPVSYSDIGYGFAWFTAQYRGYKVVHHPGGIFAFTSLLAFIHDLDLGVFITTNGPEYTRGIHACNAIFYHITDLILGLTPWLSQDNVCPFLQRWLNITKASTTAAPTPPNTPEISSLGDSGWANVHDYLGEYGNRLLGDLCISQDGEGGGLFMRLNQLRGRLYRTTNDSVLLGIPQGSRHFLSFVESEVLYLRLKFLNADPEGRYQDLVFSFDGDTGQQEWSFQRGVRFDGD